MTKIMQQTYQAIFNSLYVQCPRLSGNMSHFISLKSVKDDEVVIVIEAPQYDLKKWEKTGAIIHTGTTPDYAFSVNENGHFNSGKHCKYWVNDALYDVCEMICLLNKGKLFNDLPLNQGAF